MAIFLDLTVVAVFALCTYLGMKRGLIKSVMGIVIVTVALIGSFQLNEPVADHLKTSFVDDLVTEKVEEKLDSIVSGMESFDIFEIFKEKPGLFDDLFGDFKIDSDDIEKDEDALDPHDPTKEGEMAEQISKTVSEKISKALAFALVFVVLLILLKLITLGIDLVAKLPVLKQINSTLGFVLGAVKGLLYAWGLSIIIYNLLPQVLAMTESKIPVTVVDATYLVKLLGTFTL